MHLVVFIHLLFINLLFNASLISCRKLRLSYQGCEATAAINYDKGSADSHYPDQYNGVLVFT